MNRRITLLGPLFFLSGLLAEAHSLDYLESSQGLMPPEFEGGRTEIEFADVDDDGNIDLVSIGDHGSPFINTDQHGIMVWFGDGAGNWTVHMEGNFGYGGIAIGDINNDGAWDAAYAMHHNYASGDLGDQIVEAALGDGTGRVWVPWDDGLASAGETWGMFGTDLADIDNDGDLDLGSASFGCCAGLHVYANQGDGSWTHSWGFLGGNSGMDFLFGDVNADGFSDLVAAHDAGTIYLGDGTGSFVNADGNLAPGGTVGRSGPSLGDIDNDGDLDIAYRGASGSLQVWRYETEGLWSDASSGLPTSGIAATQLADMDQDGFCDVIAIGSGQVRIWRGDGGVSWVLDGTIQLPSPGSRSAFRVGGDVDHNGRPDIGVICEQGSWPNEQNVFHLYREASEPTTLAVRILRPRGGESWVGGSSQFVDWISEVPSLPARVSIDLSRSGPEGPWTEILADRADGGRFQWQVPRIAETDQAYLRIRLTSGSETVEAVTPRAFTILLPEGAAAMDPPSEAPQGHWAFPNPSDGSIHFSFTGGAPDRPIDILDVTGRQICVLPAGVHEWDGRDARGRSMPMGRYFARFGETRLPFVLVR